MKPASITLLFFILFVITAPAILLFKYSHPIFAQDFNFNRAHNDYLYTFNQYRQAHDEYIVARQAYLNYQTLTSKAEAHEKTLNMLKWRDETARTYLIALRTKLAETTGVVNYEQSTLYVKLDDDISWFTQHKENLTAAGSLEDLIENSNEAKKRYSNSEKLIYQTLVSILAAKEEKLRDRIEQVISALEKKIAEIRQQQDKDPSMVERWLLEAKNRVKWSRDKQNFANQIIATVNSYDPNKSRTYFDAQSALEESHQYLKEATFNLSELIREVKRAD